MVLALRKIADEIEAEAQADMKGRPRSSRKRNKVDPVADLKARILVGALKPKQIRKTKIA